MLIIIIVSLIILVNYESKLTDTKNKIRSIEEAMRQQQELESDTY